MTATYPGIRTGYTVHFDAAEHRHCYCEQPAVGYTVYYVGRQEREVPQCGDHIPQPQPEEVQS